MKPIDIQANRKVPTTRVTAFGPALQARLQVVADSRSGEMDSLDLRLYRRVAGSDDYATTSAGFRLPRTAIRELAEHMLAMLAEMDRAV